MVGMLGMGCGEEWMARGLCAYTYKFLFVGIPQFILYLFQRPWQLLPVGHSVCLSVSLSVRQFAGFRNALSMPGGLFWRRRGCSFSGRYHLRKFEAVRRHRRNLVKGSRIHRRTVKYDKRPNQIMPTFLAADVGLPDDTKQSRLC